MLYHLIDSLALEHTALHHAAGLLKAKQSSEAHLSAYLPWVSFMQNQGHFEAYIQGCIAERQQGLEDSFVILHKDQVAGRIGFHYIHKANRKAEIGYWLAKDFVGKGLIAQSLQWLIERGFQQHKFHRLELKAATTNLPSRRVAEQAGFQLEGTMRQAEWVNGQAHDLMLYSLLAPDWSAASSAQ